MYNTLRNRPVLWSSFPIVMLGLLLATLAILIAPWPSDPAPVSGFTVSHLERTRGQQVIASKVMTLPKEYRTTGWYGRRILDGLAYGLLAFGYASVSLAAWYSEPRAQYVLTAIGVAGVLYSAWVGLWWGPILAAIGFSLVLFGAGLSWASDCRASALKIQIGFSDHETHSAA